MLGEHDVPVGCVQRPQRDDAVAQRLPLDRQGKGGEGRPHVRGGRRVGRLSQQVGVHDPAVPFAGLGPHPAHLVDDVGEAAAHEQLVGRAEVGAPAQLEVGVAVDERSAGEVPVEHHDDVAESGVELVDEAAARGDVHGSTDAVQRDSMTSRQQLRRTDARDDVVLDGHAAGRPALHEGVDHPDGGVVERGVAPHEEADRGLLGGQPLDDVRIGIDPRRVPVAHPSAVCRRVAIGVGPRRGSATSTTR